jgi:hypothetical protein
MASWGAKRKTLYVVVSIILAGGIVAALFFGVFYKKPTCFDGKQNGTESGIDCGGACRKVCEAESVAPKILWARAFQTSPGVYNVAAYIENQNINSTAKDVPYIFRLFDEQNILVYERKGKTDIEQNNSFVVFEPNINTGNRNAKYAFFEFEKAPNWQRVSAEIATKDLKIRSQKLEENTTPVRFEAIILNSSFESISDIEAVAVLYNAEGNAIAVSRTVLDGIPAEDEITATFTWNSLPERATRYEVILRVL